MRPASSRRLSHTTCPDTHVLLQQQQDVWRMNTHVLLLLLLLLLQDVWRWRWPAPHTTRGTPAAASGHGQYQRPLPEAHCTWLCPSRLLWYQNPIISPCGDIYNVASGCVVMKCCGLIDSTCCGPIDSTGRGRAAGDYTGRCHGPGPGDVSVPVLIKFGQAVTITRACYPLPVVQPTPCRR